MKIHEYQAKQLFQQFSIPVPRGRACFSVKDVMEAAKSFLAPGRRCVVKAQIHAGGRGKAGGVKLVSDVDGAQEYAKSILGQSLVTIQTGLTGQVVRRLLVEEGIDIAHEFYASIVVDRVMQLPCMMLSAEGGMDIEEVAENTPEKIHKVWLPLAAKEDVCYELILPALQKMNVDIAVQDKMMAVLFALYNFFRDKDVSLVELNPLVQTTDNQVIALDGKVIFDSNALFRHPELAELRDFDEEDSSEVAASQLGLSYISLSGDIGCLVNGAGLAMATMDVIQLFGGQPANFLDVGGGATVDKVREAFRIMLSHGSVRAILVNIFGGIMHCDIIANGLIQAVQEIGVTLPLVVRMRGTNEELGKELLEKSGLIFITATDMADAAQKVVTAAQGNGE